MIHYPETRQKAQSVLKMTRIIAPPVDVERIAVLLGFKVVLFDFPESVSAVTKIVDGVKVIGVNTNHPQVRQRFSIAHEIGHYLCGHENFDPGKTFIEPEKKYTDPRFQQEKEADEFAAELLMPEIFLKNDILAKRLKAEDLASRYNVSEQAMWIQLISLKLTPGDEFSEDFE